jgi:hypothetical protein
VTIAQLSTQGLAATTWLKLETTSIAEPILSGQEIVVYVDVAPVAAPGTLSMGAAAYRV